MCIGKDGIMEKRVKAFFIAASILFAALGLFGLIYCGSLAIRYTEGLRYSNWLESGSVASAAIVASFSCAACIFGGAYGLANRNNVSKMGGCIAIAVMSLAYFAASFLLCINDSRIVIVSIAGVLISCFYILMAYMRKKVDKKEK